MRTPPRILVADDNLTNLEVLRVRLNAHGYEVVTAVDGEDALRRARELEPDLVLLDIMMPKLDGISVLKELKRDTALPFIPVILVTAKADTRDVVSGLEAGGDDYLAKPFAIVELVARVEALLRRPAENQDTVLRVGPLELDLLARTAKRGERRIELLPREFRLLEYMARRKDQLLTRAMLFEEVWNYKFVPRSNLVDVHMGRLRRKVDQPGEQPMIHNIRGEGFVLRAPA